jgi:hypothetical protein
MLRTVAFLHILFFAIGLVEAVLSMIILFEQRLFPTNFVLSFINKVEKD